MVGKLILNSKYLIFHIHEPRYRGLLQYGTLVSTGKILSIPLCNVLEAKVESGVRARKSRPNWKNKDDFGRKASGERAINREPGFLDDSEHFSMVVLTMETENGVEIAAFEVQDPQSWAQSLKTYVKSTS